MSILSDYINNDYKPLDINSSVVSAQEFFFEASFSHFPVTEKGVFVGNLSLEDIETFDKEKKILDYKFSLENFFTKKDTIWLDVLEQFARNQSTIIPILDKKNKYIGYYELTDIIQFFNETPFLKEPGNILIVKHKSNAITFSQISQIVESNNGKLLGFFISESSLDNIEITIKIVSGNMNEIIQTFRRYEYQIISNHKDDIFINTLKERSDYLNKYLNL